MSAVHHEAKHSVKENVEPSIPKPGPYPVPPQPVVVDTAPEKIAALQSKVNEILSGMELPPSKRTALDAAFNSALDPVDPNAEPPIEHIASLYEHWPRNEPAPSDKVKAKLVEDRKRVAA